MLPFCCKKTPNYRFDQFLITQKNIYQKLLFSSWLHRNFMTSFLVFIIQIIPKADIWI